MKIEKIISFCCFLLAGLNLSPLHAQHIKPLKPGEKCPDFVFRQITNTTKSSVKVSDFKEKLLILDFGGLWGCPPCIKGAIEIDSLSRGEFKNQLASIYCMSKLSYTSDVSLGARKKLTKGFFLTNKKSKQIHQIVDWGDYYLFDYFPHKVYPHLVWINPKGIIVAITDQTYLKPKYIREALTKSKLDWDVKYDAGNGLDIKQPFVVYNQQNTPFIDGNSTINYYSAFLNYIPGISRYKSGIFQKDTLKGRVRMLMINHPIIELYLNLLKPEGTVLSRIIYEVKDKSRFDVFENRLYNYKANTINSPDWRSRNTYCYDGTFPAKMSRDEIVKRVVDELNYSLGVNGRLESRRVNAWILRSGEKQSKPLVTRSSLTEDDYYRAAGTGGYISINNLIAEFASSLPLPLVDETNLSQEILQEKCVKISVGALTNPDKLNLDLQPYGLSLTTGKRDLEMLVITENGYVSTQK